MGERWSHRSVPSISPTGGSTFAWWTGAKNPTRSAPGRLAPSLIHSEASGALRLRPRLAAAHHTPGGTPAPGPFPCSKIKKSRLTCEKQNENKLSTFDGQTIALSERLGSWNKENQNGCIGHTASGNRGFHGQGEGAGRSAEPDRAQFRQGHGDEVRRGRRSPRSKPFPPARSGSISRWASAACRAAASSKCSGRKARARPRWRCMCMAEAQKQRRHRRLHRCRACARSELCPQAGRQGRRIADFAARQRRAGARDRRHAGALRRHRRAGGRFGRRADAQGRTRGRDGRCPAGPAGAPDEPGDAQAHRLDLEVEGAW